MGRRICRWFIGTNIAKLNIIDCFLALFLAWDIFFLLIWTFKDLFCLSYFILMIIYFLVLIVRTGKQIFKLLHFVSRLKFEVKNSLVQLAIAVNLTLKPNNLFVLLQINAFLFRAICNAQLLNDFILRVQEGHTLQHCVIGRQDDTSDAFFLWDGVLLGQ